MPEYPDKLEQALNDFAIELPSWDLQIRGPVSNSYRIARLQPSRKSSPSGQVHRFTGKCPTLALHVEWDVPQGTPVSHVRELTSRYGVRAGAINQTSFRTRCTSTAPSAMNFPRSARMPWITSSLDRTAEALHSRDISLWFGDRSNYPGMAYSQA